jgi:hypothetical protein
MMCASEFSFGEYITFVYKRAIKLGRDRTWQYHPVSLQLRKIVEKEIDRSNATVPGDDKIGSRVNWWFAGCARYPSNPSGIT